MSSTSARKHSDQSISDIKKLLERQPDDGDSWLSLAEAHFAEGNYSECEQAINSALKLTPDNYAAWLQGMHLQIKAHGQTVAEHWVDQGMRANPALAAPKLVTATLNARHDPNLAIQQYVEITKHYPGDSRAMCLAATAYMKLGNYAAAARAFEQVISTERTSTQAWLGYARALLHLGDAQLAEKAASRVIGLQSTSVEAYALRARANQLQNKWDLALVDYQSAVARNPADPNLQNKMGVCCMRLGHEDEAEHAFKQAVQLQPDFNVAKINLGLLAITRLQIDSGSEQIRDALSQSNVGADIRRAAKMALDIVDYQNDLSPALSASIEAGSLARLEAVLRSAPARFLLPAEKAVDELLELAEICNANQLNRPPAPGHEDPEFVSYLEALFQCKLMPELENVADNFKAFRDGQPAVAELRHMAISDIYRLNIDRSDMTLNDDDGVVVEARLRYVHARLLASSPRKYPGQLKILQNTIGARTVNLPTAPEHVAGTFRKLFTEILPGIYDPGSRGIFLYCAICKIHGFADGNGRLARFLLSWISATTARPGLIVPPALLPELSTSLDVVLSTQNIMPLLGVLAQCDEQIRPYFALSADIQN